MLEEKIFAEGVAQEIKNYLTPEFSDVECTVVEPKKNNNVVLTGVCFHRPGQQADPIVYVEPFYDEVKNGRPKEEAMKEMAKLAEKGMEIKEIPEADKVLAYGKAKEYLCVRIVNTKANRKRLTQMPHQELEDLSLTLALCFPLDGRREDGSVEVTDELMGIWGMEEETLFQQAWRNMEKRQPPVLQDMGAMFGNLLAGGADFSHKTEGQMFVLTNQGMRYGASALACPGVMEKISRLFPEGFYILPSSIHEVLIVPKDGELVPKELGNLVREVNQIEVSSDEVLSDRVYEFDREKGKIRQIPESLAKERGMER